MQAIGKPAGQVDDEYVRQHHANRAAADHAEDISRLGRQGDGDNLRLGRHRRGQVRLFHVCASRAAAAATSRSPRGADRAV